MTSRLCALLVAGILWPTLSFGQNIFIDSPLQAETVIGPMVTLRMSLEDFQLGQDGSIMLALDGTFIGKTDQLRVTLAVPPGTHEIKAWLVNRRSQPIETSLTETVKFTMTDPSI